LQPDARRLLLVSSSGGVLLDLLALAPWWRRHGTTWAVVRASDTSSALRDHDVRWISECPAGRPERLILGFWRAIRILRSVRPEIIVSAGSGAAVPFFLAAWFLRIPCLWISTFNVVKSTGRADRLCSRLASAVLVQRESLLATHPGAIVIGELY
jgi:hypothetical protein